ncbi:MAG: hypothetical protein FWC47_04950 [Oscillospiraceae bacterium]|nr:hypothetical protein [Oscillospiraceae bacterium]
MNETIRAEENYYEKNFFINIIICFISIILSYIIVMSLVKPSDALNVDKITKLYIYNISNFTPESHEFKRFILYVFFISLFAYILSSLYRKLEYRIPFWLVKIINPFILTISFLIIIVFFFKLIRFDDGFYAELLSIKTSAPLTILVFGISLIIIYMSILLKRSIKYNITIVIDIVMILICLIFFKYDRIYRMNMFMWHLAPVFNPIYEISQGHTLGIELKALYGFYGYFFYFIQMILFNRINVLDTLLIINILSMIIRILLYITIYKLFKSKVISLAVTSSIIFFCQVFPLIYTHPHYQYYPIRVIIPVLVLFFIVMLHYEKNSKYKNLFFVFASLSASLGIFWNIETGLISLVSLVGYILCDHLIKYKISEKDFWNNIKKYIFIIILSLGFSFIAIQIITKIRSGLFLRITDIFWGIKVFAGDGFYMIPLPEGHPYILVLGIYSIVLITSIFSTTKAKQFERKNDSLDIDPIGTAISILGFGLFYYYLGRSHAHCFAFCIWPAFICLAYIGIKLYKYNQNKYIEFKSNIKNNSIIDFSFVITYTLVLSISFFIFTVGFSLYSAKENYESQKDEISFLEQINDGTQFINKYRSENLFVFNECSMYYLSMLNLKNDYIGSAKIDFFFKDDYMNVVNQIDNYKGRIIITDHELKNPLIFEDGETYKDKLERILNNKYKLVGKEGIWMAYDSIGSY